MLARVRDEVDVERADPLLEDAPHRLAEVRDDPHEGHPREAVGRRGRAVVALEQDRALLGGEAVVRAEVAEVEERVAHPGVFPVDDADPPAAATVAACSTSRLMPRRCVSLPARRTT